MEPLKFKKGDKIVINIGILDHDNYMLGEIIDVSHSAFSCPYRVKFIGEKFSTYWSENSIVLVETEFELILYGFNTK